MFKMLNIFRNTSEKVELFIKKNSQNSTAQVPNPLLFLGSSYSDLASIRSEPRLSPRLAELLDTHRHLA